MFWFIIGIIFIIVSICVAIFQGLKKMVVSIVKDFVWLIKKLFLILPGILTFVMAFIAAMNCKFFEILKGDFLACLIVSLVVAALSLMTEWTESFSITIFIMWIVGIFIPTDSINKTVLLLILIVIAFSLVFIVHRLMWSNEDIFYNFSGYEHGFFDFIPIIANLIILFELLS